MHLPDWLHIPIDGHILSGIELLVESLHRQQLLCPHKGNKPSRVVILKGNVVSHESVIHQIEVRLEIKAIFNVIEVDFFLQ